MAGRRSFVVAHPDNENHVTELKGGKAPTFATWVLYTEEAPHPAHGAGWLRMGWSYQTSLEDAQAKALPDFRKYGMKVTATRVLPASL